MEIGDFPGEVIPTSNGGSAGDRLKYLTGSALVAGNGQIRMYARLSPKFASWMSVYYDANDTSGKLITNIQNKQSAEYIFSYGGAGGSYAKIKESDRKLYVKLEGGTEAVSTNAIAFAQYDEVELFLSVGNNVASVAKYRVNGGAWVDLVLGTITNAPAPGSGAVRFFSNDNKIYGDDEGYFTSWLHHLAIYDTGTPDGV